MLKFELKLARGPVGEASVNVPDSWKPVNLLAGGWPGTGPVANPLAKKPKVADPKALQFPLTSAKSIRGALVSISPASVIVAADAPDAPTAKKPTHDTSAAMSVRPRTFLRIPISPPG